MRFGIVGVDPQGRLELPDRLVGAALLPVDHAQVVVRFGNVGVDPQRRLELPDRLVEAALLPVNHTQVVVRFGIVGLESAAPTWSLRIASSRRSC